MLDRVMGIIDSSQLDSERWRRRFCLRRRSIPYITEVVNDAWECLSKKLDQQGMSRERRNGGRDRQHADHMHFEIKPVDKIKFSSLL